MDKQKVVIIAEKVKVFAMAFIGVCFFSLGTSYFQERMIYRVPRILMPVYELLGNVGLAVGMLLLGGGLIAYGFTRWKKVSPKVAVYWIPITAALVVGIILANSTGKPQSADDIMKESDAKRQAQIEELRSMEKPDFNNAEVEKILAEYDTLYKKYEQNIAANDTEAIHTSQQAYGELSTKLTPVMQSLNNTQKAAFARYWAKLAIKWNDLTMRTGE